MTEQQPYDVIRGYERFELRRYSEHLLAEVTVDGPFEAAGNRAFHHLFAHISGENRSNQTVSMTVPVVQSAGARKIALTAPGVQESVAAPETGEQTVTHRVAFVLPEDFTLESTPQPINPLVILRAVLKREAAVIRFSGQWAVGSGQWGETRHLKQLEYLRSVLPTAGLTETGGPRFVRFDPQYRPWFLRRNETILDVSRGAGPGN